MAQVLGLSNKAFQEWDYVLKLNGASIDSFGVGMKSLQNAMAGLTEGGKSSEEMFTKLGLSFDDVKAASPEEAMEMTIKALQAMPPSAEKTALALDAFGKQGMALMPVLNQTAEETDALRQKANDLGMVMSDASVKAGDDFGDALDTAKGALAGLSNTIGTAVLPTLTDLIVRFTDFISGNKTFAESFGPIGVAIVALTAGIGAYIVVANASAIASGVATAAQWLWNAAMAANPIGLLIAGVAALATGIAFLVGWINRDTEAQKALKDSTTALKDANDGLLSGVEGSKKAYEDSSKAIIANAGASEKLADKVFALAAVEGKSEKEKRKLAVLVDQLNQSMPELNLQYDAEADALNKTTEEVHGLIAAKKEEAKQQAARERAVELAKEQLELEEQLNAVKNKQAEWDIALEDGTVKKGQYKDATKELLAEEERLTAQHIMLEESINFVTDTMVESSQKQIEASAALVEQIQSADQIQAEIVAKRQAEDDAMTASMIENANQLGMTLDEYKEHVKALAEEEAEATKKREETLQKYTDLALDMFDKIETKSKVSVTQMAENLEHNQKVINEWGDNILALEGKIDKGLLDKLKEAGPESAATVNALVNANDKELERLNTVFATGTKTATDALLKQLGLPEVTDSGKKMVDDIAKGVDEDKSLFESTEKLVKETKKTFDTSVTSSNFPSIGENIIKGVIKGLDAMAGQLEQRIQNIMSRVAEAARAALDVHSPSGVFEKIAIFVAQGFIRGLDLMSSKVDGAVSDTFSGFDVGGVTADGAIAASRASSSRAAASGLTVQNNNTFYVNSELDVQRISNQLARQTEIAMRGRGILAT